MNLMETLFVGLFWASTGLVMCAYVGYPTIVYVLSRAFGREPVAPVVAEPDLPHVALLIAAHNEEAVINERIQSALKLDYPRGRLGIVVASDGSDDETANVVRRYAGRVRLLDFVLRRGKSATLNNAIAYLEADIVIFSDANTFMESDAIKKLARWFADPSVGVVCGRLVLTDPQTGRNVDSLYWRYETFLKKCESRLGALLGANGAIYAMRRSLYEPIASNTIVDDFVIPLSAKLRSGCRIIYDCDAIAHEETAPDLQAEFRRRARIGAGGFQAIGMLWRLLDPRRGWVALAFCCHKVLRWLCPFLLIASLCSSTALCRRPLYSGMLLAQIGLYSLCLLGVVAPSHRKAAKPLRALSLFAGMNLALLVGFFRWLSGTQGGTWSRTARLPELKKAA